MEIREKLKLKMDSENISQQKMSRLIKISQPTLGRYLKGGTNINRDFVVVCKMLKVLGYSVKIIKE